MPTFETDRSGLLWDATAVSNAFLCEYMPAAPEGHVKVYLYGLMCAHAGTPDGEGLLDDAAQALGMARAEVEHAMRYWERCRLVERIQDSPPRYRFLSVQQALSQRQLAPADEAYEAFAQSLYAAFGDRRKLHGSDTAYAYEWVEQLRLPAEVVLMLIQHMISTRGVNFSFKAAEKLAVELSEKKIVTIEAAEAVFSRSEAAMRGAKKVLNHLGMYREPTMDETDLYLKWTGEWGFEPKAILEACKETTKSSTPTFAYLDKVLQGIHDRSGGRATSERRVKKALAEEKDETARIRELLQALGISMTVIDGGVRSVYHAMEAYGGHEVIMLAARRVALSRESHTLDNVMRLLEAWSDKGLRTAGEVEEYLRELEAVDGRIKALMQRMGRKGGCSQLNRALMRKWLNEWHVSDGLMDLAAEYAAEAERPLPYMDKLLGTWRDSGVSTEAEAREAHARFAQGFAPKSESQKGGVKRVIEQQYEQREYDPKQYDGLSPEQLEEMNRI